MEVFTKRFLLFTFGCTLSRVVFAYLAKYSSETALVSLGYISLIPMLGFLYIYAFDARRTGPEVFGDKIWWNDLRPIHAFLYAMFAYSAINKSPHAWGYLMVDAIFGFITFCVYHYMRGDFEDFFIIRPV
jgi:hypothetical protein